MIMKYIPVWNSRLAKQEILILPGQLVLPLVSRGLWKLTVVLYCLCSSYIKSVVLYFHMCFILRTLLLFNCHLILIVTLLKFKMYFWSLNCSEASAEFPCLAVTPSTVNQKCKKCKERHFSKFCSPIIRTSNSREVNTNHKRQPNQVIEATDNVKPFTKHSFHPFQSIT